MTVVTSEGKRAEIDNIYELIITNPEVVRYKRTPDKSKMWNESTGGAWLTPCAVVSIVVREEAKQ